MRTFLGVVLGLVLFFPGIIVLQSVSEALGLYDNMTLTDGCLVMIIILQSIIIVRGALGSRTESSRRSPEPNLTGESHSTRQDRSGSQPRRPQGRTRP